MKKTVIIIAAISAAFFVPGGSGVRAQSPSPTITVVAEPPGDNCEFGGVKVTVTPAEETPTPEPTDTATPEPTDTPDPTETPTDTPSAVAAQAAEPDVEYVCNGQPGEPGQDGLDGQDGQDGQDGMSQHVRNRRRQECSPAQALQKCQACYGDCQQSAQVFACQATCREGQPEACALRLLPGARAEASCALLLGRDAADFTPRHSLDHQVNTAGPPERGGGLCGR